MTKQEDWQKEFDEFIEDEDNHWSCYECDGELDYDKLKQFISSLLDKQKKESQLQILEDIGNEIKKMRKDKPGLGGLSGAWIAVKNKVLESKRKSLEEK